jgi:ubiquitin carboxyl-terminal hydrolase L3
MASMRTYVYNKLLPVVDFQSLLTRVLQLLDLVAKPVKAVILLFPIRGKLEELRQQEEARIKEEGKVPVDPTVFWIKQTVRAH